MTDLKKQLSAVILPKLQKDLGYRNKFQTPKVMKVVVSSGVGRHHKEKDYLDAVSLMLTHITGQKPAVRAARKSIASFKVREGAPVGMQVTLRGQRMYDFLERLTRVVFPRMRDFRGIDTKGFDGRGGFTFGFTDVAPFPEATPQDIDLGAGMQMTVVTTAKNKEQTQMLLSAFGFPFKN